jgi:hypothetical protein
MKYFVFLFIILFFSACSVSKKTEKLIYGRWEITSVTNNMETSETFNDIVNNMASESFMVFNKDKSFTVNVLNKQDTGFWNVSEDGKNITIYHKPYYFVVKEKAENKLTLTQVRNNSKLNLTLERD